MENTGGDYIPRAPRSNLVVNKNPERVSMRTRALLDYAGTYKHTYTVYYPCGWVMSVVIGSSHKKRYVCAVGTGGGLLQSSGVVVS